MSDSINGRFFTDRTNGLCGIVVQHYYTMGAKIKAELTAGETTTWKNNIKRKPIKIFNLKLKFLINLKFF